MKRLVYILIIINILLAAVAVSVYLKSEESKSIKVEESKSLGVEESQSKTGEGTEHRGADDLNILKAEVSNNLKTEGPTSSHDKHSTSQIENVDLHKLVKGNPFYQEAAKVLGGKLMVEDAEHRTMILNYCEHFRSAYDTKDIDFIRQVFSEKALIIVGKVVKTAEETSDYMPRENVEYNVRSKQEYLRNLSQTFMRNGTIRVRFTSFRIMRHPTMEGIYGVTLRQKYDSDTYSDDGYLFLLWDFRNPSRPKIHVRTWQPAQSVHNPDDVFSLSDFNLN